MRSKNRHRAHMCSWQGGGRGDNYKSMRESQHVRAITKPAQMGQTKSLQQRRAEPRNHTQTSPKGAWERMASNVGNNGQLRPQTSTGHQNFFLKNAPLLNLWKWKPANTFCQTTFLLRMSTPRHKLCTYEQRCTYKNQAGMRSWFSVHLKIKGSWVELRLQTSPWTLHLNI